MKRKTFKGLPKDNFITELNDRYYDNWYGGRGAYLFKNGLCYIGFEIGLDIIQSKTETKGSHANFVFFVIKDITNYETIIEQFNLSNSLKILGKDCYIIKDNFNTHRQSVDKPPFTAYNFKKLADMSGCKLTTNIKSFERLKIKAPKN